MFKNPLLHKPRRIICKTMKNNTIYRIMSMALIILSASACSEKIELELDGMDSRIAIDARVTNISEHNRVLLHSSSAYLANEPAKPLEGARIRLLTDKSTWYLQEKEAGEYVFPEEFTGEAPSVYVMEVETGEGIYRAESALKEAIPLDSITMRPHPWLADHHELLIHFQDPPGEINYYLWRVYKNGDLLTDSIHKVPFADSEAFSGRYVRVPIYIMQPEDGIPQVGDSLRVEQYRITEAYFHFLVALRRNQGAAGGPFVGPPSNIPSNFDEQALGFFMTASVTSSSMTVR